MEKLVPVDTVKIFHELLGITYWYAPGQGLDYLLTRMRRAVRRLRTLIPEDFDLADDCNRVLLRSLSNFVEEMAAFDCFDAPKELLCPGLDDLWSESMQRELTSLIERFSGEDAVRRRSEKEDYRRNRMRREEEDQDRKPEAGGGSKPASSQAQGKRFRVALSFAGEYRPFVVQVADILATRLERPRVFYDKYYEAELARLNLDTYLQQIYCDGSDLIAVFLCAEYEKKDWCGLEWRAIRELIKKRSDAIMPLRFDNTEIPGLFSHDGYVEIGDRSPAEIAALILQRLEHNDKQADS